MKIEGVKFAGFRLRLRRVFDVATWLMICFFIAAELSQKSFAADCGACAAKKIDLTKNSAGLKQHEDLLAKNKDYLSKINVEANASQAIKVKSNILVIVLRIDTFKNNIDVLKKEIESPACSGCQ